MDSKKLKFINKKCLNLIIFFFIYLVKSQIQISSLNSIKNSSQDSFQETKLEYNPLIVLGRESFLTWIQVQTRYPTDIYFVMIQNYLDGCLDLSEQFRLQKSNIYMILQGSMNIDTQKIIILKWIVDRKFKNFGEGHLIDINNVYFYRMRYENIITKNQYQLFLMIHKYNFKISFLEQIPIPKSTLTYPSNLFLKSQQNNKQDLKSIKQQILNIKIKMMSQQQAFKNKVIQILLYQGYSMLSQQTKSIDLGYQIIQDYIKKQFGKFLVNIKVDGSDSRFTWINMSMGNVFLKIQMYNRQYLLCTKFTGNVCGLVSFKLNRYFQIQSINVVEAFI